MKKLIASLIIYFVVTGLLLPHLNTSKCYAEEDDAFLAILALNYCHFSLYKIIEYNDRIVLDEEYNNIINNINLTKINDAELIVILKELMDVLTQFKLDERSKEKLLKQYEKNVEKALYSMMSTMASNGWEVAKGAGTQNWGACAVSLAQAGTAYMDYRNSIEAYRDVLDEAVWQLEGGAIERINESNKKFLETYWQFMKKYNAPDKWRLTQEQFGDYLTILKDKDDAKKYRNLLRMEDEFHSFPPYWYYRGAAAQKIGKREDVLNCYTMYDNTRKGFFRQDKSYSSVVMLKVVETDYQNRKEVLNEDLVKVIRQDRKDWRKRLFCAYKFIEYGDLEKAKEHVQANIDNNKAVSVSRKALGDIYFLENDKSHLQKLIEKTIADDTASNQEVLYLIGKLPADKLVEKIRAQIVNIAADIDTNMFGKDDLVLLIPQKWILDDPENLSMKLQVNTKEYSAKDVKPDKEKKNVVFIFEKAIDSKELLKEETSLPLAFFLNTQAGSVEFFAEMTPAIILTDKGYTDRGVELAKSATGGLLGYVYKKNKENESDPIDEEKAEDIKPEDKKEVKILKFVLNKIRYLDTCFQILEDNSIVKCSVE